jgi:hypothetical protein
VTWMRLSAPTGLGIGSGHPAVAGQQQAQRVLGFPGRHLAVYEIGLGYLAGRCGRSAGPTAGLPTRSCTGTTGNTLTSAVQAGLAAPSSPAGCP